MTCRPEGAKSKSKDYTENILPVEKVNDENAIPIPGSLPKSKFPQKKVVLQRYQPECLLKGKGLQVQNSGCHQKVKLVQAQVI